MKPEGSIPTLRLIIHGHVQGVGFRYSARSMALKLGLSGFVRNLFDGSVEVTCQGSTRQLLGFVTWAKTGPLGARVDSVAEQPIVFARPMRGFRIEI